MANIWHDISPKRITPEEFIAVVEIPKGSKKQYELDNEPLEPLTLVRCYPIGMISMIDSGRNDEKIIAIPVSDPTYNTYTDIKELPGHIFEEMQHFFRVYKNLEGKDTAVNEVSGRDSAVATIAAAIESYIQHFCKG